jgi:hypothetical protein
MKHEMLFFVRISKKVQAKILLEKGLLKGSFVQLKIENKKLIGKGRNE